MGRKKKVDADAALNKAFTSFFNRVQPISWKTKTETTITFACKCGEKLVINIDTTPESANIYKLEQEFKEKGWKTISSGYLSSSLPRTREQTLSMDSIECLCPKCKEKFAAEKIENGTFYEKITYGYFENKVPYDTKNPEPYRKEQERLDNMFKQMALADVGLAEHPKADKIYWKAWEDGHANGYHEVYNYLLSYADLLKD